MANFLDDLSIYNAKAAAAISAAVVECNNEKANMMSSLKTTANDITLSEEIRLNALTALINLGNLLDVPLPPYFPVVTTYANTQEYVGIHNDLQGLQGGAPGEYYHLTAQEKNSILNKASLGDITWEKLGGVYSDNAIFGPQFDGKQDALSAPGGGTYYVRITGNTIFYDNSVPTASITGIVAGGELTGTYPNPGLSNAAVISKVLTGWNGSVAGTITASDTILTALQKLNANINNVITNPSGVASVALTNNAPLVFTTTTTPQTGAASLNLGLNTQNANLFLASPNGTSGLPSFRAMVNADLPVSGAAAGNYGSSTFIPQITVNAQGVITAITTVAAASGGQVNTVGLSVPGILSPSSVTGPATDPVITLALDVQPANYVWAGPTTGVDDVPFFRLLVEADIPQLPLTKITGLQAAIANKLDKSLNDGAIWIGDSTTAPVPRGLSQDILVTNTGVVTIQPNVVDFSKMQEITGANVSVTPYTPGNLLGRWQAGEGDIQEVSLSGDFILDIDTGELSLAVPIAPVLNIKGGLITYSAVVAGQVQLAPVYPGRLLMTDSNEDKGLKWVEAQGDIEVNTTLLDGTFNIKSNAVTLGKIQQLPAYTVIGNATSTNPATPTPLTKTQLTTLVNQFTIDTAGGNTALPGVVPGFNINGFPAGKTAADYFLNAAGGWSLGGGGSGSGTVSSGGPDQLAYYSALGTVVQGWASSSSLIYSNPSGAIQNLSYTGQNGLYLKVNSSSGLLEWAPAGSGSGTVNSGTQYRLAYYATNGTAVSEWNAITGSRALVSDGNGLPIASSTSTTQLNYLSGATGTTGTNNLVFDTSPTLVTPTLGVASATSINKVVITAPATSATLTIADSKTFTVSNTLTFTGADGSSVNFPGNGTVAYTTTSNSWTAGVKQTFAPNATNAGINVGSLAGDPSAGVNGDIVYNSSTNNLRAYIAGAWVSLGGGSSGVTSFSAGTTGLLPNSATPGPITLTGTLNVANGGTGATNLTGVVKASGTNPFTAGSVSLTSEVSGLLPVGNGGTGVTTNTAYAVVLGGTTNGGALTQVVGLGSAGEVLTSNGPLGGPPTWQAGGGSVALNNLLAATGSNTPINNAQSTIQWNWNSNTTTNAFVLNSTNITTGALFAVTHSTSAFTGTGIVSFSSSAVTSGNILSVAHTSSSLSGNVASFTSTTVTTGAVLNLGISGGTASSAKNLVITNSATTASSTARGLDIQMTNTSSGGNTIGAFISNTKTATTNTAIQLTASGSTTNYAIDVVSGISRFAAGTATFPQIVLSPSSLNGALTGTTNGSIWYDTTTASSNSSLYLYKDSGLTKFITLDRNPDFATGSGSGVVLSSNIGTLSKGADLTALGIFAASDTTTIANTATTPTTMVSTSLVGSKTLPANFFGVGKTIEFKASGTFTLSQTTSGGLTFRVSLGGTLNIDVVLSHNNLITAQYFEFVCQLTCSAISGTNSTYTYSARAIGQTTPGPNGGANVIYGTALKSATAINTAAPIATDIQAFFGSNVAGNTIVVQQATATYLN